MIRTIFNGRFVSSIAWMLGVGVCIVAIARAADDSKSNDSDGAKNKKARAEARGPLPAFYRDVIDGIQREQMYKIHESYEAKIEDLRKQLTALGDKRDAEMAELLRPDQKERVKQLTNEAKTKRAKKSDTSS